MADEVKPADSAHAPAGSQTVTPAATAATATDTSQVELQRLRTELGIERKRREDTQRDLHQKAEVIKRYEQAARGEESEQTQQVAGFSNEILAATVHRAAFLNVAVENASDPMAMQLLPEVQKLLADPDNAARYARSDPADTYREALRDLKLQAVEAANAELRKQLEARGQSRETLKAQAVVSGSQVSGGESEMSLDDFRKMPLAEQKEALKKMGIYRG